MSGNAEAQHNILKQVMETLLYLECFGDNVEVIGKFGPRPATVEWKMNLKNSQLQESP